MKIIGIIGGMSWESSAVFYKAINQKIKAKLGNSHSAKCLMYSVDFAEIAHLQHTNNWEQLALIMIDAAQKLEKGGADFVVLCTNTMHLLAKEIEDNISIPFIHIADATALEIKNYNVKKVGLLGTKFTMEQDFFKTRIIEKQNIETIIPNENQREIVHNIIYEELVKGIINPESREKYLEIIEDLIQQGAEGIILGCTEISLLITTEYTPHILFDTTEIYASKAVKLSVEEN
jgi:aspartate racemase